MRIAMFSNSYKPTVSGVVTSMSLFRQGLIAAGHEVHIIVPEYGDYEDEEPYVFRFPAIDLSEQVDFTLVMPFKAPMVRTLRGLKPDVIHSQHPIWMGDIAASFARELGVPLVLTMHSHYDQYARRYVPIIPGLAGIVLDQIIRYVHRCTHVVAPTAGVRNAILREYTTDVPVSVVPTPVGLGQYLDLAPARIRSSVQLESAELLLYTGRLALEKDLDFLLRAFATIAAKRPLAHLLIVGRGPQEKRLRRMAQKLRLSKRVVFTGPVPHSEIPHYAAAADLFVFPGLIEVQPLVLIEAMAAGTPVVAVEAAAQADLLAEGGGVLVPPDEHAFADTVLELLQDAPRRRAMGEKAIQIAQHYSVPSATARLVAVYEEAIEAGPRLTK